MVVTSAPVTGDPPLEDCRDRTCLLWHWRGTGCYNATHSGPLDEAALYRGAFPSGPSDIGTFV